MYQNFKIIKIVSKSKSFIKIINNKIKITPIIIIIREIKSSRILTTFVSVIYFRFSKSLI